MTGQAEDLMAKHVELVQQTLPRAKRLAVLIGSNQPIHAKMFDKVRATAGGFGMDARAFDALTSPALDPAFAVIVEYRPDALLILTSALFYGERERISTFALDALGIKIPQSLLIRADRVIEQRVCECPLLGRA